MKTILYKLLLLKIILLSPIFLIAGNDPEFFLSPWMGIHTFKYDNYFGSNATSSKMFTDLCGGLKFSYAASKEVHLRSELAYVTKSFINHYEFEDLNKNPIGEYSIFNKFSFISVPAELQFNIYFKNLNIYFFSGLYAAYLQKQLTYANLPESKNNVEIAPYKLNNIDLFKRMHFGYNMGMGIEYKLSSIISVFTEYKYERGVTNIYKKSKYYNKKLNIGYISLGMKFGIF